MLPYIFVVALTLVGHVPVHIEAIEGESLDVETVAFIPNLPPGEVWPYPDFLGLDGFLNRIRFAVDPEHNLFYFGRW